MRFAVGQLIRRVTDSNEKDARVERIIFIDGSGTHVATFNVEKKSVKCSLTTVNELEAAYKSGSLSILDKDHLRPPIYSSDDLKEKKNLKKQERRDKRWAVIAPLVSGQNAITLLDEGARFKLIQERTEVQFPHGTRGEMKTYTRQAIEYYLRLWWVGGMTKNALLGRYENCGAPGKERVQPDDESKKFGRPSSITLLSSIISGVALTDRWLNIIRLGVLTFFMNEKRKNIQEAYRKTLRMFCPKGKDEKGELIIPAYEKGEVFSPRQFEYKLRKMVNEGLPDFLKGRHGEKRFNLQFREMKSHSTRYVPWPGALYQIDTTIADVYLISRLNSRHLIGRVVICVVIDVFSRLIVGFSVRPEREKWAVINLALKNVVEDKVEFCKRYGIEIEKSDWPNAEPPERLCGDNGVMKSYQSDDLTDQLGIDVTNEPVFRPDWKGIVEAFFRQLGIYIIKDLPGFVDKKRERGDRDCRLDAALTIDKFIHLVIKAILYHNNTHYMKKYPLTPRMVKAGVKPIPVQIYNWGMKTRTGRPRQVDADEFHALLLPKATAKVTELGILFRKDLYTCDLAEKASWRLRARNLGNWAIPVSFDPGIPQVIFYLPERGASPIPCKLMHPEEAFASMHDLAEIETFMEIQPVDDIPELIADRQGRSSVEHTVEQVAKKASKRLSEMRANGSHMSNKEYTSGLRDKMKTEADDLDRERAEELLKKIGVDSEAAAPHYKDTDDVELLETPHFENILDIQDRMMRNGD